MAAAPAAPIGYYWGDDGYGVEHGPDALAARLAVDSERPQRMRVEGADTSADEIAERLATAPLFGGGTLLIVAEPAPLVSSKGATAKLVAAIGAVAPGNGLAFTETVDGSARRSTTLDSLRDAVTAAGGEVRQFPAPKQGEMARWIQERAKERGTAITPQAAALLAERVGAFVREGDVDRRRQGILAVGELEKLALYRPGRPIEPEDVRDLVSDAVPASVWAFLDAVALRRGADAADLAERLVETIPGPVLIVHLHRRLKELLEVAELLSLGNGVGSLVRTLKLKPYRAEKLAEQARTWTPQELEAALAGLLELDGALKGRDGGGDARRKAAVTLWLAERLGRPAGR